MGLFTKDIKTMDDLFLHTLQDIYYAENKIVKSLPDMIANATDGQLKSGLKSHLGETKGHVQRLEQVFQMLGKKAKSVDCPAIDGIIDEAGGASRRFHHLVLGGRQGEVLLPFEELIEVVGYAAELAAEHPQHQR